jgi:hypothetical protein
VPKDLVIFSPLRGRPNTVLNRRLPETTARAVLFIIPFEDCSTRDVSTNLTRCKTFPGAACLKRFPVIHTSRKISRGCLLRAKAAPSRSRYHQSSRSDFAHTPPRSVTPPQAALPPLSRLQPTPPPAPHRSPGSALHLGRQSGQTSASLI